MKTPDEFTKLYRSRKSTREKRPTIKTTHTIDGPSDQQARNRPDQSKLEKA